MEIEITDLICGKPVIGLYLHIDPFQGKRAKCEWTSRCREWSLGKIFLLYNTQTEIQNFFESFVRVNMNFSMFRSNWKVKKKGQIYLNIQHLLLTKSKLIFPTSFLGTTDNRGKIFCKKKRKPFFSQLSRGYHASHWFVQLILKMGHFQKLNQGYCVVINVFDMNCSSGHLYDKSSFDHMLLKFSSCSFSSSCDLIFLSIKLISLFSERKYMWT